MTTVALRRHPITLSPQSDRLILRPFLPSDATHIAGILRRVLALSEHETERAMDAVLEEFSSRHLYLESALLANYDRVRPHLATDMQLSRSRRLLIGAQFSGEYSLESAALFNPSIVMHPDQSDAPDGAMRFILSLRGVGEGHISSIEFRTGIIDAEGEISIDATSGFVCTAEIQPNPRYKRK